MHHQGFERLIRGMDEVARRTEEPVVMQIGASSYEPAHAEWFRFDEQARVEKLSAAASVIVSHAGAGTIISAFRHRRPLVVVPRRSGQGEHVDDHQLELARALSAEGKVISVEDPTADALDQAIARAGSLRRHQQQGSQLASAVARYLEKESPAWQPVT
jgi:UDP-N-acetylglucosamine transferase subunit ALG13